MKQSVQVDAIPPERLRSHLEAAILQYRDENKARLVLAQEEREYAAVQRMVRRWTRPAVVNHALPTV